MTTATVTTTVFVKGPCCSNSTMQSTTMSTSTIPAPNATQSVSPSVPCHSEPRPTPSCTCALSPTPTSMLDPYFTPHPTFSEPSDVSYSPLESNYPSALSKNDISRRAAVWSQVAYYTSNAPAQASGITFLANLGDDRKSGTFDYSFGNSLGYVSSNGRQNMPDSTPFSGNLATSEAEIAGFTAQACNGDCEYARPKSTQYHGWDGESKAFFIEFQMDHYDNYGNDQGMLSDAPAWWFLNAAIPRTLQYGNDKNNIPCSCWSTGCGEFDAFEVLGRGEERAKSTIHRQGNIEGGDSNYFARPVARTLKFAVVFHRLNITATVLDDSFDFSSTLDSSIMENIISYDPNSYKHSLFGIGT
ncbi:putative TOS1-like glycosyl hydrolase-domain-containing protein [Lophiotrema nucula]|uniref:Putative TOS1-like glycosyl hydrolase-domain-containing protein n=1 Tax=Lophiotrema nucula TaxID=690887 RepID=A0A6A5ZGE3_9PLEO|nr:putative TOS1-like glycosyl hydrolase-domain-containing protein [Lophiotrema nucula]